MTDKEKIIAEIEKRMKNLDEAKPSKKFIAIRIEAIKDAYSSLLSFINSLSDEKVNQY